MNAAYLVILVATISGVEGGDARLEAGLAHGLRVGDVGRVFYRLSVGSETKRVEVGEATVTEVEELSARCRVPAGKTRPGFLVEFELPAARDGPEDPPDAGGSRLPEADEGGFEEGVRRWIERMIPEDPRVEREVVRLLRERRPAELLEGRPIAPAAPPPPAAAPEPERVSIDSRTYLVGVDLRDADFYSQQPRFAIRLEAFHIDARPVTRAEYGAFREDFAFPDTAGEQATGVTWAQAEDFCRWRGQGLPTEFQWEIAMKSSGLEGGLMEWTSSWYEPYPGNRIPEPEYGKKFRVVRGGPDPADFDVHRRRFAEPDSRHPKLGFRCAGAN